MRTHLATLVADFRRHGAQTAIVCYRGNRRHETTYIQLAELAGRFAAELVRRGIQPGERVLVWGENSAEWVAAFFGCVLRGVLAVPLDSAGSRDFAHRVLLETTPRLVVGTEALLAQLPQEPPQIPFEHFAAALPQESMETPLADLNPDTPLQILFTSGTTGAPKGIVHTHRNILASLTPIEHEVQRYLRYERWVHPLRFLHTLPLSHVFGQFVGLWTPPLIAAEVHYEPRLLASQLVERIHRERISLVAAVPRVLDLLRSHLLGLQPDLQQQIDAAQGEKVWWRWWRFRKQHRLLGWKCWAIVCGGATLSAESERFWTTLGFALLQGYGMTETAALVTLGNPLHPARGTIGKPLPGREVQIGKNGELLVRGEMVFNATWQQGRMVPRESGWLATGDLAERDEEGNLRFLGRKGDLIVTAAGMNIHPQDLEQALERQPGVRECTVVGISSNPEDPTAQEPVAVLLATEEAARNAVEAANRELAEFQQMRRWLLWPGMDLPRTSTGKVVKRTVAAWAQQALSATGSATATSADPLLQLLARITHAPLATAEDTARLSEDLHLDSLGRVELQAALEEKFGIELSEETYQQTQTLGQLRALVQPKPGLAAATPAATAPKAAPGEVRYVYPYWIWSWPIRMVRIVFQDLIAKPILGLLAAPHVHLLAPEALPQQPALFIANHVTMFDVPMVLYALPGRIRRRITVAMAGEMLMDWRYQRNQGNWFLNFVAPLEYWVLSALYSIFPLPQFSNFRRSFAHAGEALDRGLHVLVFPEGSRSADGTLLPFQTGIGLLAQQAQTCIVPVAMRGLGEIKTRRQRWFRPGTLDIYVGAPMSFPASATAEEITAALQKEIERLLALGTRN
ncbi:MAG: AMP-binding protein [Acidobacteriaceae bacterium]